jgi:predicted nucleotidyltransferase
MASGILARDNTASYHCTMVGAYGDFVRARRHILGLSQRDLAERAGVKQPLIAAIEIGRRQPSGYTRAALDVALVIRPSMALAARRNEVRELFARAGLPAPYVFGSVARGDDDVSSDIDLIVEFTDQHDIVDLLALEHDLEELLTVGVDVIDARAAGRAVEQARTEAVAL